MTRWSGESQSRLGGLQLVIWIFAIYAASMAVFWGLGVFTPQLHPVFPRRYGYVPNTIFALAFVALLLAPRVRRAIGIAPGLGALLALLGLWLMLQIACLPVIRAQDASVWRAIETAMAEKRDPRVLFVNAWNHPDRPGYQFGVSSAGLRGLEFPDVFESTLANFWWESLYAVSVLGAKFAADKGTLVEPSSVKLFGTGLLTDASVVVAPKDSLIVVADLTLRPPAWQAGAQRAVIFTRWEDFQASAAAHPLALDSDWGSNLVLANTGGTAIALGQLSDRALWSGVLPDKRWSDPAPTSGPIANYGLESGDDRIFAPSPGQPLAYFLSNRHGAYTYRIDFANCDPRIIVLDVLELWHVHPGGRRMRIEAALDNQWFTVGTIDPAGEAGKVPLAIKIFAEAVHSFRVRLTPAPGSPDIPFLNGIRILPGTLSAGR
jgi:hypothetical protein